jgi:hypothetical protein
MNWTSRKLAVLLVIFGFLAGILATAGCDLKGCSLTSKTVVIQPVHILSMYDTQDNIPFFCFSDIGTGPFIVSPLEVIVGYSHSYYSGWPCWESINQIYQGAVWFPVAETIGKKLVQSATLTFTKGRTSANSGEPSCAVSLCRDDEDSWWNRGRHGLTSYSDCLKLPSPDGGGNFSIDVTSAVQDWVYGRAANNGFVLIGPISSFDQFSDEGMLTQQQCVTWYHNFALTVTFFETTSK